jgi:cell wall-associated NlpC family hydrolase
VATISVPVATASAQRSEVALSYGTRLVVEERTEDRLRLRIPTGEVLEVAAAACRPQPATGAALVAAARGLGGLAYLWGGCSGFGLDCSGLTHLTHRVAGRRVPRDADEQAGSGLAVGAERAAVGDLLFFARSGEGVHHVGFSAGLGRLLHSPRTGRTVEEISLDVAPYRDELVALDRRYVGVGTAAQPSMNTSGGT